MSDEQIRACASVLAWRQFASEVVVEFQPSLVNAIELGLDRTLNDHERRLARVTYERERLRLFEANRV